MVIDFLMFASRPSTRQWLLISLCSHQDPLRSNGHWFLNVHIKALYEAMVLDFLCHINTFCKAMVIDFLIFISGPSARQWSLISLCLHQDPLRGNGHWLPYAYIMILYETMVIDFLMFTSRPSSKQWSWFFFTLRPSTRQWSSISLHQGPLQDNGHWFLCQIGTLYMIMFT